MDKLLSNPFVLMTVTCCLWPLAVGVVMSTATWMVARGYRVRFGRD